MHTTSKFLKTITFTLVLSLIVNLLQAQAPMGAPVKDIQYTFSQNAGTNASAVAWNSKQKIYITVIAGNAIFPLEGFNTSGKLVFSAEAGYDWRGMWYNTSKDQMEGNGAADAGWTSFKLNANNTPETNYKPLFVAQNQPDMQSVGAYNSSKKQVVFISPDCSTIYLYSREKPTKVKKIDLQWGDISTLNINHTSIGYTGVKHYEYVLLDYNLNKLMFFDTKGKLTATRPLPEGTPGYDAFAFSYANNRVFLYNKDKRTWYSYKVFDDKD